MNKLINKLDMLYPPFRNNFLQIVNKSRTILLFALFAVTGTLFTGCATITPEPSSTCKLFDVPPELTDGALKDSAFIFYTSALKGKKFFLDPGHGGDDRKNKSPNGLVIEADINLKVALYLRDFLVKSGAVVYMSRDKDQTVELKKRTNIANKTDAEFFISVHHNAPGKASDRFTNYASTYYHATEEDYEHHPSNRDLARYINRDLAFNTGTPAGLASFDGTISDYLIYPGEGFSVLRNINIPAVLVECTFFTNLNEELRLADTMYNMSEAWGIYKGIGKYFRGNPPTISLKSKTIKKGNLQLKLEINSKQPVLLHTIKIYNNKTLLTEDSFSLDKNILTVDLGDAYKRETEVKVIFSNKAGLYNLPFKLLLTPEVN